MEKDKLITKLMLYSSLAQGIQSSPSHHGGEDTSTKVNEEVCPNCGETHKSNKHLYCSKQCAKEQGKI